MICFIILHYMVENETENCVISIKKNIKEPKKILIVDNASPNGSGQRLQEKYSLDPEVEILFNNKNIGFARGNNKGYQYVKTKYSPEFIVILNNDVEIVEQKFSEKIRRIYEEEKFYVLGPDIYATSFGIHQSPKRMKGYSYQEVKKLNQKYKKELNSNIFFEIKCVLRKSSTLKLFLQKMRRRHICYTERQYNVPLHGACLIFSQRFIQAQDAPFLSDTFFYYECEILDYRCRQKGFKTVYAPEIRVEHHHHISTDTVYQDIRKRMLFVNQCSYDSTLAFLTYMARKNPMTMQNDGNNTSERN